MLNQNEQAILAAKLLRLTVEEVKGNSAVLEKIGALYFSEPIKGGASILVGQDGTVLFADSSVDYDDHVKEFENGRRTPLDAFE